MMNVIRCAVVGTLAVAACALPLREAQSNIVVARACRSRRSVPRRAGQRGRYVGLAPAGAARCGSSVDLRDHARRHSALRRDEPARSTAACSEPASCPRGHQSVCDQRARLECRAGEQAAGADRRPHRLHAAVFRRVLGSAGHAARGYRSHRGDQRSGCDAVGCERGQRCDQRDHPAGKCNARCSGRCAGAAISSAAASRATARKSAVKRRFACTAR